jgi:putative membrane protein insertion efficiency factor
MRWIAIWFVRGYQLFLSPLKHLFGVHRSCRFEPTCSHYAIEAFQLHGFFKGGWLALRRICRCHPWGPWGYDPVPPCKHPDETGAEEDA